MCCTTYQVELQPPSWWRNRCKCLLWEFYSCQPLWPVPQGLMLQKPSTFNIRSTTWTTTAAGKSGSESIALNDTIRMLECWHEIITEQLGCCQRQHVSFGTIHSSGLNSLFNVQTFNVQHPPSRVQGVSYETLGNISQDQVQYTLSVMLSVEYHRCRSRQLGILEFDVATFSLFQSPLARVVQAKFRSFHGDLTLD